MKQIQYAYLLLRTLDDNTVVVWFIPLSSGLSEEKFTDSTEAFDKIGKGNWHIVSATNPSLDPINDWRIMLEREVSITPPIEERFKEKFGA